MPHRLAAFVLVAACASTPAVLPAPPSAGDAYRGLQAAVTARQRAQLWALLDERTRAAWQIAWHARRSACELRASLSREDAATDPELSRLPAQPPSRAEDLFAESVAEVDFTALAANLDPKATLIELGSDAEVLTASGDRLAFRRAGDGKSWGFTGLGEPARHAAQRELGLVDRALKLITIATPGLQPGAPAWR